MSAFEYASILLSIVAAWNVYAAVLCVDCWFPVWHVRDEPVWSLGFVVFLLELGSLLYLACHVAMPDADHGRPVDRVGFRDARARRDLPAP